MFVFLKCFGQAFLKHGLRAAADLVPLGGAVYDIAVDGWTSYRQEKQPQDLRDDLQAVAQATGEQFKQVAEQVVAAVGAGRTAEDRQRLAQFLDQVPRSIRQSFRRTTDPT